LEEQPSLYASHISHLDSWMDDSIRGGYCTN
jgi:hypothetical protein